MNNTNSKVAIVIPIYKSDMTCRERISLDQCLNVLGKHQLFFIAPSDMATDCYHAVARDKDVVRFDPRFFRSIETYNRLMLAKSFYETFLDYEFILIYQLDAFVFSDQLQEWCSKGYDYVGSPWIESINLRMFSFRGERWIRQLFPFWNPLMNASVGNGGFSLRNVRACLRLLDKTPIITHLWRTNEDCYFSYYGSHKGELRIPTVETALTFGFEQNPSECYRRNNYKLPFGCHAWERWDIDFWRPIFREHGYEI